MDVIDTTPRAKTLVEKVRKTLKTFENIMELYLEEQNIKKIESLK